MLTRAGANPFAVQSSTNCHNTVKDFLQLTQLMFIVTEPYSTSQFSILGDGEGIH